MLFFSPSLAFDRFERFSCEFRGAIMKWIIIWRRTLNSYLEIKWLTMSVGLDMWRFSDDINTARRFNAVAARMQPHCPVLYSGKVVIHAFDWFTLLWVHLLSAEVKHLRFNCLYTDFLHLRLGREKPKTPNGFQMNCSSFMSFWVKKVVCAEYWWAIIAIQWKEEQETILSSRLEWSDFNANG